MKKTKMKTSVKIIISAVITMIIMAFSLFIGGNIIDIHKENIGWKKWNIDATLNADGSMDVVEVMDFFNDKDKDIHVVEKTLGFSKANSKTKINNNDESKLDINSFICIVDYGNPAISPTLYRDVTANSKSPVKTNNQNRFAYTWCEDNVYDELGRRLEKTKDGQEKILLYVADGLPRSGLKITYRYRVENVISKYNDYAIFNWKIAGFFDDADTNDVTVNIKFPESASQFNNKVINEGFNNEGIGVLAFGNTRNELKKLSSSEIECHVDRLIDSKRENIELFISFNNSVCDVFQGVSNTSKTTSDCKDMINDGFLKNEVKNVRRNHNNYLAQNYILGIISGIIVLGSISFLVYVYIKFDKERKPLFKDKIYRELPSTCGPAEMVYLVNEKELNQDALNGELLELIRLKYIILDTNGSSSKDKKANYILRRDISKDINELSESRKQLISLYFDTISNGKNHVSFDEIDAYMKKEENALEYNKLVLSWEETVKEEAEKNEWFDEIEKPKPLIIAIYFLIVLGFVALIFALNKGLSSVVTILLSLVIGISLFGAMYYQTIERKSEKGIEEYTKWMAFKTFLKEFSNFKDSSIDDIDKWGEYMVYASAFGISELVEKQLRVKYKNFKHIEGNDYNPIFYFHTCYYLSFRMDHSREIGTHTIASSHSSSSGGGGSSFGGGGSGGSFR